MSTVPPGWSRARLGEVCQIVSGGTPKTGVAEYWGGDIVWITPDDLSKDRSQHIQGGTRTLTLPGYESCSARVFPAGSVVFSSRAPIGYVAIAGREMATNQGCKTAVPPDYIESRYLYHYLRWKTPDIQARASGTTFKEISAKGFGETQLIWPGAAEQRRIVEILEDHLSRLDSAGRLLSESLRRVERLRRVVLDSVTRRHCQATVSLGDLVERIEAGKSFGSASRPAQEDEWGIVRVSAMTWGEFRPGENKVVTDPTRVDPRFEIREGDLLVSRANTTAYVGAPVRVGPTRPKLLLSDKSLRIVPKAGVSADYLLLALSAPAARAQMSALATGTKDSMRNISQASLLTVQVPTTDTDGQRRAVTEAEELSGQAHRLSDAMSTAQDQSDALRRALLAAAFSGRLTGRASDWDRVEELAGV